MTVRYLTVAAQEQAEAVEYYNREKSGLGYEFAAAVDEAIERVVEYPQAWPLISKRVRQCRIRRFPYGIIYQAKRREILIVGIMHLQRNPRHWKDRI